MIRTKAKNLLLVIMLVFTSFCLYGCKEKPKVSVESVSFVERGFNMLVGDEKSIEVKVLPSYATNRSYTLISSDVTALKVEGGAITALKASLDIKLKVVSNDNAYLNDVITVNIYDKASKLKPPTQLAFDGNKFTFIGSDNANAYMLKVNGKEINIGNNTEYSYSQIVEKFGDLNNEVVNCSVKALGDGKVFEDSDYIKEIPFVKVSSVSNLRVEDGVLKFDAIKNVASYTIDVLVNGVTIVDKTRTVVQSVLDLEYLVDDDAKLNGVEYKIQVTPNIEGYAIEDAPVSGGDPVSTTFNVVGKVNNVELNGKTVSWDFVKNAQSYVVELYKNDTFVKKYENITSNNLLLDCDTYGAYYIKVLAKTNNANTVEGLIYSNVVEFTILDTPVAFAQNNNVYWSQIVGASRYQVTIRDSKRDIVVNKVLVPSTQLNYAVDDFAPNIYTIQVVACGDEQTVFSSKASNEATWVKLAGVEVAVADEKLKWKNQDTLNQHSGMEEMKYSLMIDGTEVVVGANDYSYENSIFIYDLEEHIKNFEPGTHEISVRALGNNANVFDAEIDTYKNNVIVSKVTTTKLDNSQILSFNKGLITFTDVRGASKYEIKIYNQQDLSVAKRYGVDKNATTYQIPQADQDGLTAGLYQAKVFVYGNGAGVFDADNDGVSEQFSKLATPKLSGDGNNLVISADDKADGYNEASSYKLWQNNGLVGLENSQYSLSQITSAGIYAYKAQAISSEANVLDSNITNIVKVKKLSTPTITFDKTNNKVIINCADAEFVEKYEVTQSPEYNLQSMITPNANSIDITSWINNAGQYKIKATAIASTTNMGEFIAIVNSNEGDEKTITKLDGACTFEMENEYLKVTPKTSLVAGKTYKLDLTIKGTSIENISINDLVYNSASGTFRVKIYDVNNYKPENTFVELFDNAGAYQISTKIKCADDNIVDSQEILCVDDDDNVMELKALSRVESPTKVSGSQTIKFDKVEGATSYKAVVVKNNVESIINLNETTSTDLGSEISVDVKTLVDNEVADIEYRVSIIAVSADKYILSNRGVAQYVFKFLSVPTLEIVRAENSNNKLLNVDGDAANTLRFDITLTQGEKVYSTNALSTNLDNVKVDGEDKPFDAGNITITAIARSKDNDNYFDSQTTTLNVNKLTTPELRAEDGQIKWGSIQNSKQYVMYKIGAQTVVWKQFESYINIYDCSDLGVGNWVFKLQAISNDGNYLNSEVCEDVQFYKLTSPTIGVDNGKPYIEILSNDIEYINRFDVLVNGINKNIDISLNNGVFNAVEGIAITSINDRTRLTIEPELLIDYGTDIQGNSVILRQYNISTKLFAQNVDTIYAINSDEYQKSISGLLSPMNLDITTSTTIVDEKINEVLEKITWSNPSANLTNVNQYQIVISYNNKRYSYTTYGQDKHFMMPSFDDKNENEIKDDGEDEFGAGKYTIKIKALTNDCLNIVNSIYSEELVVTVLSTPKNLATANGNVVWEGDRDAGYYLINIYKLEKDGENIISTKIWQLTTANSIANIDLSNIDELNAPGVYGIGVQAMNSATKILASKQSELLQVVRLPQATDYFVQNGTLNIKMHKFFTKAEITLAYGTDVRCYTIKNNNADSNVDAFIKNADWLNSGVLSTYEDDNYINPFTYRDNIGSTILYNLQIGTETIGGYTISVKLFGNSQSNGAIISGQQKTILTNVLDDENYAKKLIAPTLTNADRGEVDLGLAQNIEMMMQYYKNSSNSLQGVYLYQVNISASNLHTILVADIIDKQKFEESLTQAGTSLQTYSDASAGLSLKYFVYQGITFNVADVSNTSNAVQKSGGKIKFDFNNISNFYYFTYNGNKSNPDYIALNDAGSFSMIAHFMGDDAKYLSSDISNVVTVIRYASIKPTITQGQITWANQKTEYDKPVYVMTITNANNVSESYNLVLYNEQDYPIWSNDYIAGYIYYDTFTYNEGVAIYDNFANKINAIRGSVDEGVVFNIAIKAHYTSSSSSNIILSQTADPVLSTLLSTPVLEISDGMLIWEMISITTGNGTQYIKDYKLGYGAGSVNLEDSNYTTYEKDGIKYAKLDILSVVGLEPGNHTISLTALGYDPNNLNSDINSVSLITSSSYIKENVEILGNIINLRVENGKAMWDNGGDVELCITSSNGPTTTFNTVRGYSYNLSSYLDGIKTESGYTYTITARLKGSSSSLSGAWWENPIVMQRLSAVDYNSIKTDNGLLVWDESKYYVGNNIAGEQTSSDGIVYTINYAYVKETVDGDDNVKNILVTGVIENFSGTEFDFAGIEYIGYIYVQIIAHHSQHFSSFVSNSILQSNLEEDEYSTYVKLYKLPTIDTLSIKFDNQTNNITWEPIKDDKNNIITNYEIKIISKDAEGKDKVDIYLIDECYSAQTQVCQWIFDTVGVNSSEFEVLIRAMGTGNLSLLNAEYCLPQSMTKPSSVTDLSFNKQNQWFEWSSIEDKTSGDTYYIGYELVAGDIKTESGDIEVVKSDDKYIYKPTKIGIYSDVYVKVVRAGSFSSKVYLGEDINFNIFSSGKGTSSEPYLITEERHLRNIKYFPNAYYEIPANTNTITLASSEPILPVSVVFTGTIEGNGATIDGCDLTINKYTDSNNDYIALFPRVENAKFIDLSVTRFNIVVPSCDDECQNVYLGIMTAYAQNATFTNVNAFSSTITVANNSVKGDTELHIGAISGYSVSCTFTNCVVKLNSESNGNQNTSINTINLESAEVVAYVGGIVGSAEGGKITDTLDWEGVAYFVYRISEQSEHVYAGTLVGHGVEYITINVGNTYQAQDSDGKSLNNVYRNAEN